MWQLIFDHTFEDSFEVWFALILWLPKCDETLNAHAPPRVIIWKQEDGDGAGQAMEAVDFCNNAQIASCELVLAVCEQGYENLKTHVFEGTIVRMKLH